MSYYVIDVEADGPVPEMYSMVCFSAIKVTDKLDTYFYGEVKPVSKLWLPSALAISGFSREEHEKFSEPVDVMDSFYHWIMETNTSGRPIFMSDNNSFDWQWINYYFHKYSPQGKNPFGYSSRRISDLYCGLVKDSKASWKHLRKTKHDHNPINDAKGNAEALLAIRNMGLKITFN